MIAPLLARARLLLAALTATAGCRGGIDSVCRCNSDCRAGLVCEAEGEKSLEQDMCFPGEVKGTCVEEIIQDSDSAPQAYVTEIPVYDDLPSRRDFQPGGSISESLSDATSDTTAGQTDGSGTTGTSTGDSSSGSSSSTGDSSTTGTTGTTGSTGDTDSSTGDASSSSSGSSSGSSSSSTT